MLRRQFLPLPLFLAVTACSTGGAASQITLVQVQAYSDDLINALAAAAQAYGADPNATQVVLVDQIVEDLQQAKLAIDSAQSETDARAIALEVVSFVQQLLPIVTPFLGAAGPYVPLAVAVLQAFVTSLPVPPNTPVQPPAELHRLALKYHARK
jgi:hypothetical protein